METLLGTSGSLSQADLPPGAIVGEYRIERKLKQGGMGTVYEAVHTLIQKRAAVKVLKRELCENDEALHRFVQEARAVNQINHQNIVDVFGFGVTEDGRSFLAMELLVGETLGERMARAPVSRAETCDLLVEITHALEAAHACGVVHRDLKPENVFLAAGRGGQVVKLLDFGIAKLTGGGGLNGPVDVTQPGTLIGTPKYIAPEQARGLAIDGSADVYALGVLAFELLTGRAPFMATDPVELIAKHITLRPPAPSDFVPELPPVADELVGEMLDKHPPSRPSLVRIRELLEALRLEPANRAAAQRSERTSGLASGRGETVLVTAVAPRRRWWLLVAALALIAITVRLGVGLVDRGGDAPLRSPGESTLPVVQVPPTPDLTPRPTLTPIAPAVAPADAAEPAMIEMTPPSKPAPVKKPHKRPARPNPEVQAKPPVPKPPVPKPPEPPSPDKPNQPDDRDGLRDPFHR